MSVPSAIAPTRPRAQASRGRRPSTLRQVLKPFNDDLDILLRLARRVPEMVEVHPYPLGAGRRNTRRELLARNDVGSGDAPAARRAERDPAGLPPEVVRERAGRRREAGHV